MALKKVTPANTVEGSLPGDNIIATAKIVNPAITRIEEIDVRLKDIEDGEYTIETFNTDTINEKTAGNGVTVDGVLLKDGTVTTDTIIEETSGAGVTADGVLLKDGNTVTLAGATNDTIITAADQAIQVNTYNFPDVGANADVVLTQGAQTVNGTKTFGDGIATDTINEESEGTGVNIDSVILKDGTIKSLVGAVGTPGVQVGSSDTGFYQVSATQTGVSQDGTLVSVFDSEGIKPDSVQLRTPLGTPSANTTVKEFGDGKNVTTVITLTDFVIGALAGVGADLGIGSVVYEFPAGQHFELVYSLADIVLTAAGTAVNTDTGLGSVVASGAVFVLGGTGTFEDRLTGQTIATGPLGGAAVSALTAATAGIGTGISLNTSASVKGVFLNSAGTWNADNTGNLTASGTIVTKWTLME